MKYSFYIVDVFSPESFGGNQLAVLPDAVGLSAEGMQKIAREFNFAESTFVLPPDDAKNTARVRIFTPAAEVKFAGHPTVGTACALVAGNHVTEKELILEELIGPVPVSVSEHDGVSYGELTNNSELVTPAEKPDLQQLAKVLSLKEGAVLNGFYGSLGLDFCLVQLASGELVDQASINREALQKDFSEAWSKNIFVFSGPMEHNSEIYARMFAPKLGIEEDPATGSAVAVLVGHSAVQSPMTEGEFSMTVTQGVQMGRRSVMNASAVMSDGQLTAVRVGGATSITASGEMEVGEQWLEGTQ